MLLRRQGRPWRCGTLARAGLVPAQEQGQWAATSSPMSTAGALCVSRPTER